MRNSEVANMVSKEIPNLILISLRMLDFPSYLLVYSGLASSVGASSFAAGFSSFVNDE
jgi:hypothetical protein